ncbi:hypothetical protein GCM10010340_03050 [Streptomyces griseoloalbus]|nr:hypothetical protein GCM10010340_03050 [Streptomyces albaduncus]
MGQASNIREANDMRATSHRWRRPGPGMGGWDVRAPVMDGNPLVALGAGGVSDGFAAKGPERT